MKNKKWLVGVIVGITMSAASIVGLSACGKHEHSWETGWDNDAVEHWHNPSCSDTTEVKDKGEHVWDDGEVVTEPTHTDPGQKKYTCTTCKYEKFEPIPAEGHTYGEWVKTDPDYHWKEATCNDATEAESIKDKARHDWETIVDTPATEDKNGEQHRKCKVCGHETATETLYNYIGEKLSGGDKVTVGNVEDDTTVIAEQDKNGKAWTGAVKLTKLNATGKTFVYDLHVSGNYTGSWVDSWAWQRMGIQVTENTGFYLWVRDNAVTIRKFTAANKTDCEAECNEETLVTGEAKEQEYGWISNAVLGAGGADIRISRVDNKLNLHVKNGEEYQLIGTVTCGEEENEFAVYGVTAEFTFSGFEVTAMTHVDGKAPSSTEAGYFEYYYTGTDSKVYYDAQGKLTTWDELVRPAVLETVEVTLQTKKDGQTAALEAESVKVDGEDVAVTGGKITLENIEPNTEIVITAGDYTGTLKVTEATANVVLEYNFATATGKADLSEMNDADHAITFPETNASSQSEWTGAVTIKLTDEEKASKAYVYDMNIKMSAYTGSWVDVWAWQRYAIQLTDTTGFYLWSTHNPWNADTTFVREFGTSGDKDNRVNAGAENAEVNANETANGWIYRALISDGGADFRFIRVGEKITLYVHNGENYAEIGSVNCGDSANNIVLYAINTQYKFSEFNMSAMTHVDGKAPSATEAGYYEHYYTGTDSKVYYDAQGKLTTWAELVRPAVLETVEITLQTKKDGQTAALEAESVKVDGEDVAVTGGKITLTNVEPNTEIVITVGEYTGTLKVTATTANVVLEYNYATGSGSVDLSHMNDAGHAITVTEKDKDGNAWTGSAVINDLKETGKTFVYDLHVSGKYAGSWNDAWAYKRFGIQVTENTGFYLWVRDNAVTIRKFTADNKTNCGAECQEEVLVTGEAKEQEYGWISNAVLNADGTGADFRIIRVNDKLNLYVKNADGYQLIGTVTCGDEANSFAVYGVTAEFTFSGFEVTAMTHVEATDETAEHYYTGEDTDKVYYDADGKLTTLDKLAIVA